MLKTITKVKEMKLDELIKYIRENKKTLFKNRVGITFSTKNNNEVTFYQHGELTLDNWISSVDLFTVEIEEEITEDTEFESVLTVLRDKFGLTSISYNTNLTTSIKKTIKNFEETNYKPLSVYALIDGKLELIYEVKDNNREE